MKILVSTSNARGIRKVTSNWYRITINTDRFDLAKQVVDIIKTEHREWSVCDDDVEHFVGRQADDKRRYVFTKIRAAKAFALDLAKAFEYEKPYPRSSAQKYCDLD